MAPRPNPVIIPGNVHLMSRRRRLPAGTASNALRQTERAGHDPVRQFSASDAIRYADIRGLHANRPRALRSAVDAVR